MLTSKKIIKKIRVCLLFAINMNEKVRIVAYEPELCHQRVTELRFIYFENFMNSFSDTNSQQSQKLTKDSIINNFKSVFLGTIMINLQVSGKILSLTSFNKSHFFIL